MRRFFKGLIVSATSLAVGFIAVFGGKGIAFKPEELDLTVPEEVEFVPVIKEQTHQSKLLKNVMATIESFNINGEVDITTSDDFRVVLDLDVAAQIDIENTDNIKLAGDINLRLNGAEFKTSVEYINNTIFFAYKDNKFKLETDDIVNFLTDDLLGGLGINASLPDELANIDLAEITNMIQGMEEEVTPSGQYFFNLSLGDLVTLKIKTDSEYRFKGIRMNEIDYEGTKIKFDFSTKDVEKSKNLISAPADALMYQNFKPAFNIFKGLINVFGKKQNTIVLNAGLSKESGEIFSTDLALSYDLDEMSFGLEGAIKYNEKSYVFDLLFKDNALFFEFEDLKITIDETTIFSVVDYVLKTLDINLEEEILGVVSELLSSNQLKEMIDGLGDLVKTISVTEEQFSIELDTNAIGLGLGVITPTISFKEDEIEKIDLGELKLLGYGVNVGLSSTEYSPVVLEEGEFQHVEPVLTLVASILPYLSETRFNIGFDATIERKDETKDDVTIDGGVQFDLNDLHGYGELNIVDSKNYLHNVKADMIDATDFIFSYNDTLNGKFSADTLNDLKELLISLIADPDDHFLELFGEFLEKLNNTPLMLALSGDVEPLLNTNIINDLTITDTSLKANVALDMIGLESAFDVEIKFQKDEEFNFFFDGLSVSNVDIDGTKISLNAKLNEFNDELETTRLDRTDMTEYLDFSDIKVLLVLGINTSKFNYFHIQLAVNLDLPLGELFDMDIVFDVRIRNNQGKVQIAVEGDIPVVQLLGKLIKVTGDDDYDATTYIHSTLYYENDMFYIKTVEHVEEEIKILMIPVRTDKYTVTTSKKMTTDYFLANIAEVLLVDMIRLRSWAYNMIVNSSSDASSSTTSTGEPMEYEKILDDFKYDAANGTFDFGINLYALLHVAALDRVDMMVYSDTETNELTSISLSLNVKFLVKLVGVTADITLLDKDELNDGNKLTDLEEWVASRAEDPEDTKVEVSKIKTN